MRRFFRTKRPVSPDTKVSRYSAVSPTGKSLERPIVSKSLQLTPLEELERINEIDQRERERLEIFDRKFRREVWSTLIAALLIALLIVAELKGCSPIPGD